MEVVNVDHSGKCRQVPVDPVEIHIERRGLNQDAKRLLSEPHSPRQDEHADKCCKQRIRVWPARQNHDQGGGDYADRSH